MLEIKNILGDLLTLTVMAVLSMIYDIMLVIFSRLVQIILK